MLNGTSPKDASTSAIEDGRSKGSTPSASRRPNTTSSTRSSYAPKLPVSRAAAEESPVRTAGRSRKTSTAVGTVAHSASSRRISSGGNSREPEWKCRSSGDSRCS